MEKRPKKPSWAVEKERRRSQERNETVWLFGLHAVRDALVNPNRIKKTLLLTPNAAQKLDDAIATSGLTPQITEPRKFRPPIDAQSVHQGAAIEVVPLNWGSLSERCAPRQEAPLVLALDRVTDPHNVGAIIRSAEVFGAQAVIAPHFHSAPETGALAKTASGALERQPYLRVPNLNRAIKSLREMGYLVLGLDGTAQDDIDDVLFLNKKAPIALVLGAEGPGLRPSTKEACDHLVKISFARDFGSLNVSNAAAVSLYAARQNRR